MKLYMLIFTLAALTETVLMGNADIKLENSKLKLVIHPQAGARCSSFISKDKNKDLVINWKAAKAVDTRKPCFAGGAFGGHMGGSYQDEQKNETYEILEQSPQSVKLRWQNNYPLFKGLVEEREIILPDDKNSVIINIKVTNTSDEKRQIYYRMQDFIGTGKKRGVDGLYVIPGPGDKNDILEFKKGLPHNHFFQYPHYSSYAICDLINDYGLLVRAKTAKINTVYLWLAEPDARTAEFFFDPIFLKPGESWDAEIEYLLFSPSKPDTGNDILNAKLNAVFLSSKLGQGQHKFATALPYNAKIVPPYNTKRKLQIIPIDNCLASPGSTTIPNSGGQLKQIELFGTPSEKVSFAFAAKASQQINNVNVSLPDFNAVNGKSINASNWDAGYISQDTCGFIVRDQQLAKNAPNELVICGNNLKNPENITPFSLKKGEKVLIKATLRIPSEATPGIYTGTCKVGSDQFHIKLKVYPFKLDRDNAKTYGTFTRACPKPERGSNLSQADFDKVLEFIDDSWYRSIVLYTVKKENTIKALDKLAAMGWRNASIVLTRPRLSHDEIDDYKRKYGFNIFAWGVDEPCTYRRIEATVKRYNSLTKRGFKDLVFTPNVPLGLAAADALPGLNPILAVRGYPMYLLEKTRQYIKQGRNVFWYSGYISPLPRGRMLRGIYLWKEPVNGFFDWGEDTQMKKKTYALCGFIGNQMISTTRRDNAFEGLKDYLYLATLEKYAKQHPKSAAGIEAKKFLDALKTQFNDDYFGRSREINQTYLDSIRRRAAELTEQIIDSSSNK